MSVPQQYVSQFATLQQTEQQYIINNTPVGQPIPTFDQGGPADLLTGSHAAAADMIGQDVWNAQQQAYLSTATGTGLDSKAEDYNTYRKQGVASTGTFQFNKLVAATTSIPIARGSTITTIPTPNSTAIQFTTNADATLNIGATSVQVSATCTQVGSIGNLPATTQFLIASSIPGIDSVTLTADITDGIDTESDDSLRSRAQNAFNGLALGTPAWYQAQVLSIVGITSATVVGQYTTPTGVGVYVAGPNNTIPSSATIQAAQTLLNGSVPQLDVPYVLAPTALPINISLTLTVTPGTDSATAQANAEAALATFVNTVPLGGIGTFTANGIVTQMTGTLYPSAINAQALGVQGALDTSSVLINGSSSALALQPQQLPQAGTMTVSVVVA